MLTEGGGLVGDDQKDYEAQRDRGGAARWGGDAKGTRPLRIR